MSHTGVGLGDGRPRPVDGAAASPPTASQPAAPRTAAVTTARTLRERRRRLRVARSNPVASPRVVAVTVPNP
ncbi:hypothetical protein GCM10019016_073600 [Streptomyces prasinosporus]|uniref:Uncharacterized protein n=1 Tax=Streptomyces prasinosporus TaxID=68256 RepID=A0ABP6U0K8_9ACTN